MALRTIQEKGKTFVLVPVEQFVNLQEEVEMLSDIKAYDAAKARAEEGFPMAVFDAIAGGQNPIHVLREYRKMTLKALSQKAGITEAYLCQIEKGVRKGSASILSKLAKALKVEMELIVV